MTDDITPAAAIRETWRWLPAVLITGGVALGLILVAWLVIWQAGWWFYSHDVNRQANAIQHSQFAQSADKAQFDGDMKTLADIQAQAGQGGAIPSYLHAQALAAGNDACSAADQITNGSLSPTDITWVRKNCTGPALSLTSPLRK